MKFDAENAVLKKLGLDYELLDSGCCGMAGSFGFESGHYDVSVAVGERRAAAGRARGRRRHADHRRRLQLPRADRRPDRPRGAAPGAGAPDGAARRSRGPARDLPEMSYQPLGKWEPAPSLAATAAVVGLGVLAGLGVAWALTRRRDSLT